jgi:hypothetical protein
VYESSHECVLFRIYFMMLSILGNITSVGIMLDEWWTWNNLKQSSCDILPCSD